MIEKYSKMLCMSRDSLKEQLVSNFPKLRELGRHDTVDFIREEMSEEHAPSTRTLVELVGLCDNIFEYTTV